MMRTGLYNKAKIEEQVKATAAGGIGLLEVNNFNFFWTDSYSHADSDFTSQLDTFYWLMYYADKYGVKLDWTTGDMYPADIPDNSAYATARDYTYSLEFAASALSFGAPQQIFASNLATDGSWEKIVAVTAVKLDADKKVLASVDLTDDTTHVTYTPTTVVGADGNVNGTVTISESDLPTTSTDGTWYLYTFYKHLNSKDSLDYLSAAATKAWADYWENEILGADYWSTSDSPASKQKVLALFEKVSHAFWEDSLESTRMNYTDAVFDAFKQQRGYDFPKERLINLIVGGAIGANLNTGGPGGGNSAGYYSILNTKGVDFPTAGEDDRKLLNDYLTTLSDLYNVNHLKAYQDYAATHGLTTRVQAAYNYSLDQDSAFGFVGIGETESLDAQNSLDVYRTVAGSSHAQGVNVISSESGANGDFKAGAITWPDWMWIANNQFAGGVNQTVLHVVGYQYAGWGGDSNTWPGDGSANSSGGQADANGPRYPYWQITRDTALGYLAREQYVLQAGRAQNDLAMYYYSFDYGQAGDSTFTYYGDESLAAAGYSYEFVGGSSLDLASVGSDGSIVFKDADSGAVNATYKALVINQTRQTDASGKLIGQIPVDAAKKIAALAKAGGNVVIVGDAPSKAADDADQNRDAEVASAMAAAVADGALRADTESDLLTTLEQHGITAAAVLDPQTATHLKTYHRSDDGVEYYYLFNQSYTSQEGGVDRQLSIGGTQGAAPVGHDINTVVELDGAPSGVPYLLDAWSGEVTRIAQYEVTADGRYRIPLSLEQAETAIVAIGDESWHTDGLGNLPVVSLAPEGVAATYNSAGDIVLTSRSAGTFEIELLNNGVATTTTVTFDDPAQAIVPATWQLDLVAYEPNAAYRGGDHTHKNAGTVVKQAVEPLQLTELVDWSKLDLRYAEKREGRAEGEAVQGSANSAESAGSGLSGIGTYTTTVTLPSDFNAATGGYELAIEHATATFRVEVNGQQIGFAQSDFSGYTADISSALRAGENTIAITVASTIINAGKIYTGAYTSERAGNLYGYTEPDGLVGAVTLQPLARTTVAKVEPADPTVLQIVIDIASSLEGKLDNFTDESVSALQEQLAKARAVLADATSPQQDLDEAVAALEAALSGLVAKPAVVDKAVLQAVYDAAAGLSNGDGAYSAASWATLQAELADAKAVLDDASATQEQIDAATVELSSALAGLDVAAPVVATVKLNQSQLRLVKGKSFTLEDAVYYANTATQPAYAGKVTWTSSNPKVATVSANGVVKARKTGTATITATATELDAAGKSQSASIKVTVVKKKPKAKVTKVTASVPKSMKVGQVAYITGKYSSSKATGVKVTYSSSKPDVVIIDKVGRMVATSEGTEYIKVTAGGKTKSYKITVK